MTIKPSDLILSPHQRIFHLDITPEEIADTVIFVGDPDRVIQVSQCFDQVTVRHHHREFIVHTGRIGQQPISVLSTGIGTDNIDIVINELDALINVNLTTRENKQQQRSLRIIRLGTCGSLRADIATDSIVISDYAIDLSGILAYYACSSCPAEAQLANAFLQHMQGNLPNTTVSAVSSNTLLNQRFSTLGTNVITVTCDGFYAPQGRQLRAPLAYPGFLPQLRSFEHESLPLGNFEMETAGIYGLGKLLGHQCCSLSAVVVNRATDTIAKHPEKCLQNLIEHVLGIYP